MQCVLQHNLMECLRLLSAPTLLAPWAKQHHLRPTCSFTTTSGKPLLISSTHPSSLRLTMWGSICVSHIPLCSLIRWVLCANHMEPVKGFLGRYLRRKLIETEIGSRTRNMELVKIIDWIPRVWHHLNRFLEMHSSSDVTIGRRSNTRLMKTFLIDITINILRVLFVVRRTSALPVVSHGRWGIQSLVHRPVELLHHPLHAGGRTGRTSGNDRRSLGKFLGSAWMK